MSKVLLNETLSNYHGPQGAMGVVSTPQDIFIPSTTDVVHYMTPGFITQHDKPAQVNFPRFTLCLASSVLQ